MRNTKQGLMTFALSKHSSPHGNANPQTYAFIDGYKAGNREVKKLKRDNNILMQVVANQEQFVQALHELVRLKLVKDAIDSMPCNERDDMHTAVRLKEYHEQKEAAWKEAKRLLGIPI